VITTRFSNAFDRFGDALVECEERSAQSIAESVALFIDNPMSYRERQIAAESLRDQVFDRNRCYGTLFRQLLQGVSDGPLPHADRHGVNSGDAADHPHDSS
jgi:hypothetical protein